MQSPKIFFGNNISGRRMLSTVSLMLVLYNEIFVYLAVRYIFWHDIPCQDSSGNCTRILLVADPQIIGETFDENFYNGLAIVDSDRFLANTFSLALTHARPDVVCFLGDMMDEGSVASDLAFERYARRFKRIFHRGNIMPKIFPLPGDNDIGGERDDVVTRAKVERWQRAFGIRPSLDVRNHTRLVHVNLLTHNTPNVTHQTTPSHMTRVILTHISLLSYPGVYSERITNSIRPHVVFSAHLHTSKIITYPPMRFQMFHENEVRRFDLSVHSRPKRDGEPNYLEIMVPTCSYRMGMSAIGYGMAVIENNELRYTVLWLQNRFVMLYSYVAWIAFVIIIYSINHYGLFNRRYNLRSKYTRLTA